MIRLMAAAQAITEPGRQAGTLSSLAQTLGAAGEWDRSREVLDRALAAAQAITEPGRQADTLSSLAQTLGAANE